MKYLYGLIFIAIVVAVVMGFSNKKPQSPSATTSKGPTMSTDLKFPGVLGAEKINNKKALIKTNKGDITIELYAGRAPKTVSNFVYLAEKGFYDGLTFHRVVPGFVIQGGDPSGNGSGGPGYSFADEPVEGDYKEGAVAMANSGPNTNGSQFFICLEDQPGLPKQYNLFGQVTSGMDVVKKIQVGDKINSITVENL